MRSQTRAFRVLATLMLPPSALGAQGVSRTQISLGLSVSALQTSHPEGGPIGLGGSLGVARRVSEHASLRAILGVTGSVTTMDDVSVCHDPQPDGSCLADAVFPRWLTNAEVQTALLPMRQYPLGIVIGAGLARSDGAGTNRKNASIISESKTRGLWRAGVELSLGRSPRSPRIQLSRAGFSSSVYSTKFVDALVLTLSP